MTDGDVADTDRLRMQAARRPPLTAGAPSGAKFVRRIGASVPRSWAPAALRGLSGAAAHLPTGLRYRLHRLLGSLHPDMGDIARDYATWIALYDRIDADARRGIIAEIARMPSPPLISVLMPVFDPAPDYLLAAIHSVQDQFYPWWELCIGDDASTHPAVIEILRDAASRDHRVKLVRRESNGHISAASNSALRVATGRFVALLDHDDILPPHALYEVAAKILAQPDLDIIYSDEDHIDDEGRRTHPYFKPDWNAELMLGQNLISHLGVYRRSLIETIGGFRAGFEGSQDYDLALRMVTATRPGRIAHIPKVLYHWRQGAADRTFSEAAHDRCVENGRRAILAFVTREGTNAAVEPTLLLPDWTRVVYPVPEPAPLVSVIVTGDVSNAEFASCVDVLLNGTDYPALEVLIPTHEDSTGPLPDPMPRDARVRRIAGHHRSLANNAARVARGSLVLLLDAYLKPNEAGWLREMVSHALRPGVGAVGAKLLGPDGRVRHAGVAVGGRGVTFTPFAGQQSTRAGYFGHLQLARDVTAVSTQCLMIDREVYLAAGGLEEALSPVAFCGLDLCLKLAETGLRTVWTPHAELTFLQDPPRHRIPAAQFKRAAVRMRQRWGRKLDADPYWNPNLSADSVGAALAFPPLATTPPAAHSPIAVRSDPREERLATEAVDS